MVRKTLIARFPPRPFWDAADCAAVYFESKSRSAAAECTGFRAKRTRVGFIVAMVRESLGSAFQRILRLVDR